MSNMSKNLEAALGITGEASLHTIDHNNDILDGEFAGEACEPKPPAKYEMREVETSVPDITLSDAKVDYVHARNHTYTLLGMTTQALARALDVATETEHPRAFESFNSLASTARQLTQDLLSLQKTFKEITRGRPELEPAPAQANVQINGDVSVAGTTSLLDMLQKAIDSGEINPIAASKG